MISGRKAPSRLTRADALLGSAAHAAWARYVDGAIVAGAQSELGAFYANGHGVPQDYIQAHLWFNLERFPINVVHTLS